MGSWKVKSSVRNETLELRGAELLCKQLKIPLLGNFFVSFCHPEFDVLLIWRFYLTCKTVGLVRRVKDFMRFMHSVGSIRKI